MANKKLTVNDLPKKIEPKETQDYYPDNIVIDLQERTLELKPLLNVYNNTHEPSFRALAQALQNAKFALDEVNLDKIVKAYEHLKLFRS